jgi:hypothetical protein
MSTGSTGPAFRPVSVVSIERGQQPRRGRWVAALIVALVVLVFGFAAVYMVRYHPLEAASAVKPGRFVERKGARAPGEPVRLRFLPGRGTTVGVLLRNGGRLTVKLEDVRIDDGHVVGILRQTKARLALGEQSRTVAPDQTEAFRSIGLEPGETRWVVLVLRFGPKCPKGATGAVSALRVRYSVFELPKRMRVPLREGVQIPCGKDRRGR